MMWVTISALPIMPVYRYAVHQCTCIAWCIHTCSAVQCRAEKGKCDTTGIGAGENVGAPVNAMTV